jgi:tol-pal system protein YbgF
MYLRHTLFTKKSTKLLILIGVSSLLFLTGCANPDQVSVLEKRLNSLAMDNASMRQDIKRLKGEGDEGFLNASPAALSNRMDEIQVELLRINGRLDQVTHALELELARIERLEQATGTSAPTTPATTTTGALPADGSQVPLVPVETPKEVDPYKKGQTLFKQRQYKEAKNAFKEYIDKNPGGDKEADAYFLMGECEFKLERYEEAILEYQKVIDKHPKSQEAPEALYKQGRSFAELGDNIGAKIVYKKLIKKYPKSKKAKDARTQLSKLR